MSNKNPKNTPITDERPIAKEVEVEVAAPKKVTKCYGNVLANTLLNVRETPSMTGKILGTLSANTKVEIVDDSDAEFYSIKTKELTGYCKKDFIKLK